MSRIYQSPLVGFIDLDKIIRITPAEFIDNMGHGGWFVSFQIDVQLRDAPIWYQREVRGDDEVNFDHQHELIFTDGTSNTYPENSIRLGKVPVCVDKLQCEINDLIAEWAK